LPLTTIREVQYQILQQQAKADVVEEQFLALADEIMPRIKELKAIEDNLVSFCENSLEPIIQNSNNFSKEGANQNEFVGVLSSLSQMEDRLTSNQSEILQNLKTTQHYTSTIIEAQSSSSNKDNVVCIDVDSQEDLVGKHTAKHIMHKQHSSIQQFKDSKITSSDEKLSEIISPGITRLPRQTISKKYEYPTTSKIKNAVSMRDQGETSTPSRTRKRSPSPSTDDSITDTNSEARDIGEMTIESLKPVNLFSKKSNLDRKGRQWGPKRRRPGYIENDEKSVDESEKDEASLPDQESHGQRSNWQPNGFFEKDFDCSSIVSEDIFS